VGESARVDLVVVLFVPNKGKRGWGLLTLGCLDLSRYSLVLSFLYSLSFRSH
jgi:hypothetical protein